MYYKSRVHRIIYEDQIIKNNTKCSEEYLAAVYLLCAEKELWKVARYAISKRTIDFEEIGRHSLSLYGYSLYKTAQDIYTGSTHLTLKDIRDKYLIGEKMFEMIITALRIGREGYSFIGISKVFN